MASGPVSRATYWRRRVFLLVGLLAVLTLIVFACRPFTDGEEANNTADTESTAESAVPGEESPDPSIPASPSADASPDADSDADSDGGGDEGDAGDGESGGDGDAPSGGGGGGTGANAAAGGSAGGGGARPAADPCSPGDVVVTVDSDRDDYAAGVDPVFSLTLVNTGSDKCTAEVGTRTLELRITSGDDRIWSSVDCVEERTAEPVELRRGVPHDVEITWDRTRSWRDCRDDVVNARPGTYVAKVYSDYETAGSRVFRLH